MNFCYNFGASLAHFASASSQLKAHINGQDQQLVDFDMPKALEAISNFVVSQGSSGREDAVIGMFEEIIRLRDIERNYLISVINCLEKSTTDDAV